MDSPVGPGPNYFSNSSDNVWVDEAGRLHLRITHRAGRWYNAEVIHTAPLGYASYIFRVSSPVDSLDSNAVLGLFTWDTSAPEFNFREIDIEFSRFGGMSSGNAQFVVQPWDRSENLHRFNIDSRGGPTVHIFEWRRQRIEFQSSRGLRRESDPSAVLESWGYRGDDIPSEGIESPRINLWLFNGVPPSDNREVEVVIEAFEYSFDSVIAAPPGGATPSGPPSIRFTSVPPLGSFANLHGVVKGVTPQDHKVAVFIEVNGGWWNKPYWTQRLTDISSNGSFTTDITTGGIDEQATTIAAFLVPNGYRPPKMSGHSSLPSEIEQNSLASARASR